MEGPGPDWFERRNFPRGSERHRAARDAPGPRATPHLISRIKKWRNERTATSPRFGERIFPGESDLYDERLVLRILKEYPAFGHDLTDLPSLMPSSSMTPCLSSRSGAMSNGKQSLNSGGKPWRLREPSTGRNSGNILASRF